MTILYTVLLLAFGDFSKAETSAIKYKSWKTFQSEFGFEFKHPDCWKITEGHVGHLPPYNRQITFAIEETSICSTKAFNPGFPNSLWFHVKVKYNESAEVYPEGNPADAVKEIKKLGEVSENHITRKDWLIFKRLKFGKNEGLVYVESLQNVGDKGIRWKWNVYCPTWWISIGSPIMKDPDKSYFDKFKAGDVALPEPEKTIIDSIRCEEPKIKPGIKNYFNSESGPVDNEAVALKKLKQ